MPPCIQSLPADGAIADVSEASVASVNRTLAIAYKLVDETGLTLLAVLSSRNSIRRHTAPSITSFHETRTRILMVSGELLLTV
jgi:hypothetical protein